MGQKEQSSGPMSAVQSLCVGNCCSAVVVSQCDAGSHEDLTAALLESSSSISSNGCGLLPVEMVVHAGGVLADATLAQQQLDGLRRVAAAKLPAASAFAAFGQRAPVRSIVYFSSVAALLGSPGQANYAAANAGMDGLAAGAQLAGVPAVSVQWGAWAGGGMAAADASTAARVERLGMGLISASAGLAALEGVLASLGMCCTLVGSSPAAAGAGVLAAVPFNWPQFLMAQRGSANIKLLTDIIEDNTPSEDPTSSLLHPFSRTAIQDQLQSTVLGIVSSILGREVANDEPLVAAGLDSLGSVELRNTLQVRFRLRSLDLCMNDYCFPGFSRFCL
jgi:hypothetical protein